MESLTAATQEDLKQWRLSFEVFKQAILDVLIHHPDGISEHELLQHLRSLKPPLFKRYELTDHLSLFRCHFWLFHVLYHIRDEFRQKEKAELYISPLNLQILPYSPSQTADAIDVPDPLREYYLDLRHLFETDSDSVDDLMKGSFARMDAQSKEEEALSVLGLTDSANWEEIRLRYRLLAQKHHPDRGGDSERFQEIQSAIEVLKQCHSS